MDVKYLFDPQTLAAIPDQLRDNNPIMPFPDCASLCAITVSSSSAGEYDLKVHLRFGEQRVRAEIGEKSFTFFVRLRRAKLKVIAVEGAKPIYDSLLGSSNERLIEKIEKSLTFDKSFSAKAMADLKTELGVGNSPKAVLEAAVRAGLSAEQTAQIVTKIESVREHRPIELGFEGRNPVWHLVPSLDLDSSVVSASEKVSASLDGVAIPIGDTHLLKFRPLDSSKVPFDVCFVLGISANIEDVLVEIDSSDENSYMKMIRKLRGYKERKEVAQEMIKSIIAKQVRIEAPDHLDGGLFFAVAVSEEQ